MIYKIKTDNPIMEARYYQIYAERYDQALEKIIKALGLYLSWDKPDLTRATMIMEAIYRELSPVLNDKTVADQICKEFNIEEGNTKHDHGTDRPDASRT